jgi:hypothetical protein
MATVPAGFWPIFSFIMDLTISYLGRVAGPDGNSESRKVYSEYAFIAKNFDDLEAPLMFNSMCVSTFLHPRLLYNKGGLGMKRTLEVWWQRRGKKL